MPIDRIAQGASALQRAVDHQAIYRETRAIADSDRVMAVYAAPEFDELSSDGKDWIVAIVEETKARSGAADLLAACQAVLDEFPALDGKRIESVKAICRAAIAKATGQ